MSSNDVKNGKSLSDVADDYDRWAAEDDSIALRIMSTASGLANGVREEQLRYAVLLAEEARSLRDHAKLLRRSVVQQLSVLVH
jgi:hypothetical protein